MRSKYHSRYFITIYVVGSSQAFKLFREGKKSIDVAIDLDIPYEKAKKFWSQFLRLTRMYEAYELYEVCGYDIPNLLSIRSFLNRNNINGKDMANILRDANNIYNLQSQSLNLKNEVEQLKRLHFDYSQRILPPLRPLPRYYNW